MVTQTRARIYEAYEGELDTRTSRPTKRRRLSLKHDSPTRDLSLCDGERGVLDFDDLSRRGMFGTLARRNGTTTMRFIETGCPGSFSSEVVPPLPRPPNPLPVYQSQSFTTVSSRRQHKKHTRLASGSRTITTNPPDGCADLLRIKEASQDGYIEIPILERAEIVPDQMMPFNRGSGEPVLRPESTGCSSLSTGDSLGSSILDDNVEILGSSTTPPTMLCSPPEFVYEDIVNPNFGEDVQRAYESAALRESFRRDKYGVDIADMWKRGSTPEEARQKWRLSEAKLRAEAENGSDSDG